MADNAIDKLIEETRAAYTALEAIEQELLDAERARAAGRLRYNDAKKRCELLDLTMKKHIHENMPVVQAKMIAHEEIENQQSVPASIAVGYSASKANQAAQSWATTAQSAASIGQSAMAASISKWLAGRPR